VPELRRGVEDSFVELQGEKRLDGVYNIALAIPQLLKVVDPLDSLHVLELEPIAPSWVH
jgi:hypothetical protein